ncbi:hypothetical protein FKW77_007001 [Venturia effusa]|uniref:Sister chromatid cohesion protein n=1 Tax=Venturia effusa TaxID=50376 RepID=A0A517LCP5_9PEZI|nr:hypothetical protein FKW77_007001 [Venturia effusa]
MSQYPDVYVPNSAPNGLHPPTTSYQARVYRAPTVDEALRYTPLTSIVPFSPDILTYPSTALPQHPDLLANTKDHDLRRRTKALQQVLDQAADNSQPRSDVLNTTLLKLSELLKPEKLAEYKFARPSPASSTPQTRQPQQRNAHVPQHSPSYKLRPFSKMALDRSDIAFRYPTPTESPPPNGAHQIPTPHTVSKPKIPQPVVNHTSGISSTPARSPIFKPSVMIRAKSPPQETQKQAPVAASNSIPVQNQAAYQHNGHVAVQNGPTILIPASRTSSQRNDWQEFPDIDRHIAAGVRKPKRKRDTEDDGRVDLQVNQQRKADAALQALESTLDDIFEAEDQPESSNYAVYFVQSAHNQADTPVLTKHAQEKMDSAMKKAVDSKRFDEFDMDQLIRAEKLCGSTASCIEALDLSISGDAEADAIADWIQRLELAENGLRGGKVLLRIMTAGREETQLYSEDILTTLLRSVEQVIETVVIPVTVARSKDSSALFKKYTTNRKALDPVVITCSRVLRLLGDLISKVDIADMVVHKVESLVSTLIFVDNAHVEKDSALGTQRFEAFRRTSMDCLAKIYARHPSHRPDIINKVLSSLGDLGANRHGARQYKLAEGKPIQLVSALLMRLVQSSGARSNKNSRKSKLKEVVVNDDSDADADMDDDDSSSDTPRPKKKPLSRDLEVEESMPEDDAAMDLRALSEPLQQSADADARYIINWIVNQALTSTKTGESPYRNLIEIFTADFLSVLGFPDWPAAETLLTRLLFRLVQIIKDEKQSVNAKSMSLELMGMMGAGITDLNSYIRKACETANAGQAHLTSELIEVANMLMNINKNPDQEPAHELISFRGPYRVVVEFLQSQGLHNLQTQSAHGYIMTRWAEDVLKRVSTSESGFELELCLRLRNTTIDPSWLRKEFDAIDISISSQQARLASSIVVHFCQYLPTIMNSLFSFMINSQSTLQSKSMKSFSNLLAKDPAILDRSPAILQNIISCTQNKGPGVRKDALGLLAECLLLKPSLEKQAYVRIIEMTSDRDSTQVRKNSMKILKEIYLRNTDDQAMQSAIAAALMTRVKDEDDNVADLARQSFEDLWITPFHASSMDSVRREIALKKQVALIVRTIRYGETAITVLGIVLRKVLAPESKSRAADAAVCKDMVGYMFDEIIDDDQDPKRPSQSHVAEALAVFAQSEPNLFTVQQLELLVPYLQNLTTANLPLFRSAISILCHVIPSLPSVEEKLLLDVQARILAVLTVLPSAAEISGCASCLKILHTMLPGNNKLIKIFISVLTNLNGKKGTNLVQPPASEKELNQITKLLIIAGQFGKLCDVEDQAEEFRAKFTWWTGKLVSSLILDIICQFTNIKTCPPAIRETALESVAAICQGWPQHYLRHDVGKLFELVFINEDLRLKRIVLEGFLLFFRQEEKRSETGAEVKVGAGAEKGQERLQTSFIGSSNDAGATTIKQKFLPQITRLAFNFTDDIAVIATKIIVSISSQGLAHPKEYGATLIALETSNNAEIAKVAFEAHSTLMSQRGSGLDKENIQGVQKAFEYQKDILHDIRGVTVGPTPGNSAGTKVTPKLGPLFAALHMPTNSQAQRKLLTRLSARIDFELNSLDTTGDEPHAVIFARFVLENVAFVEYSHMDALLHAISLLEKLVIQTTGTVVAHAIEKEILKIGIDENREQVPVDPSSQSFMTSQQSTIEPQIPQESELTIEPARLRKLAAASMILFMAWETRTHLRQAYSLQKTKKEAKAPEKGNKAPQKNNLITGEKFLDKISAIMGSLQDQDSQLTMCKNFAELLSVDHEVKVADEDDVGVVGDGYETPNEEQETASNPSSTGKGRKRRGSFSAGTPSAKRKRNSMAGNTPKKAKGRPSLIGKKKASSASLDEKD